MWHSRTNANSGPGSAHDSTIFSYFLILTKQPPNDMGNFSMGILSFVAFSSVFIWIFVSSSKIRFKWCNQIQTFYLNFDKSIRLFSFLVNQVETMGIQSTIYTSPKQILPDVKRDQNFFREIISQSSRNRVTKYCWCKQNNTLNFVYNLVWSGYLHV